MSSSRFTRPLLLFLLLSLVILMSANPGFGQSGGVIGIFADVDGLDCNLLAPGNPILVTWHIVHLLNAGTRGSLFKATLPACYNASWLIDQRPFPVAFGDSQTGIVIAYLSCLTSPIHVLSVHAIPFNVTPACCAYPITAHPTESASGQVEVFDCANQRVVATGRTANINPDISCLCNVPTEETTWGRVKALYQ